MLRYGASLTPKSRPHVSQLCGKRTLRLSRGRERQSGFRGGPGSGTWRIQPRAPTANPEQYEKHLTLDIARLVQRRLQGEPGLKIVPLPDGDLLIPIRARTRCANQAGARLFLSIHANAASAEQGPGSQRGFEIYVLPTADVDQEVARGEFVGRGRRAGRVGRASCSHGCGRQPGRGQAHSLAPGRRARVGSGSRHQAGRGDPWMSCRA